MEEKDLTSGNTFKTLLYFSTPYLLSYFLQTLYGMADLFIIGQFCPVESTTAVSIGSQVMHIITVIIVGLTMGSTVTIARAVGAKKKEETSRAIANSFTFFIIFSIVLAGILLFLKDFIIDFLSTPKQAISGTSSYLTICFLGVPFITLYNVISSLIRSMGDSKRPMYFILIACVANIILDYIFIGPMGLKTAGAALGTTLSQSLSVVISLIYMSRKDFGFSFSPGYFKLQPDIIREILKIGIPVALQDGFIQISFVVLTILGNMRGLIDSTAVGVVEKMISIFFLVPSSSLQSVSVLVAQNVGAGKNERAVSTLKYACILCLSWGIISSIWMFLGAEGLIGLFTSDPNVIVSAGGYMRGYITDCFFAGMHFSFSGYFCGMGHSGIPFIHNTLSMLLIRIPLACYGAFHFSNTLFFMGLSSPAGSFFSCLLCIGFFIWIQKKR